MTQDEIIEMADKCGLMGYFELDGDSVGQLGLVAFAKLVAAKEREACAKLMQAMRPDLGKANPYADAIRARGEA